jgi:hypothetical protein
MTKTKLDGNDQNNASIVARLPSVLIARVLPAGDTAAGVSDAAAAEV